MLNVHATLFIVRKNCPHRSYHWVSTTPYVWEIYQGKEQQDEKACVSATLASCCGNETKTIKMP
jgi:hypothetical protein